MEYVHWLERDAMELECFLCRNTEYVIYRSLVREHVKGENWMMEEKNKKEEIENLIANYGYHEFPEPIGQLIGQVAIPSSFSISSSNSKVSIASRSILLINVKIGI